MNRIERVSARNFPGTKNENLTTIIENDKDQRTTDPDQ